MKRRVGALLEEGLKHREVAERLGIRQSTVAYHARRLDVPPDPRFSVRFDWVEIRRAYESGLSRSECMDRFGFSVDAWYKAVKRGAIVLRPSAMPMEELLVKGRRTSRHHLKTRLLREGIKANQCEECGLMAWRGRPLSVQLHHANGDGSDNRLENIVFLCPNCHSQTDTYGGRNGHRRPRPDLQLVELAEEPGEDAA